MAGWSWKGKVSSQDKLWQMIETVINSPAHRLHSLCHEQNTPSPSPVVLASLETCVVQHTLHTKPLVADCSAGGAVQD